MPEVLSWLEKWSALASWVQAVGSVAAICIAYWLGERQASKALINAQKLEALKERARLQSVLGIARLAAARAEKVKSLFAESPLNLANLVIGYQPTDLQSVASALSAVPVHELGSAEAATSILDMRDQLLSINRSVRNWEEGRAEAGAPGDGDRLGFDRVAGDRISKKSDVIAERLKSLESVLSDPS